MANHSGRISSDLSSPVRICLFVGVIIAKMDGLLCHGSFILLGVENLDMGGLLDLGAHEEQCGSVLELCGYPGFFLEGAPFIDPQCELW